MTQKTHNFIGFGLQNSDWFYMDEKKLSLIIGEVAWSSLLFFVSASGVGLTVLAWRSYLGCVALYQPVLIM